MIPDGIWFYWIRSVKCTPNPRNLTSLVDADKCLTQVLNTLCLLLGSAPGFVGRYLTGIMTSEWVINIWLKQMLHDVTHFFSLQRESCTKPPEEPPTTANEKVVKLVCTISNGMGKEALENIIMSVISFFPLNWYQFNSTSEFEPDDRKIQFGFKKICEVYTTFQNFSFTLIPPDFHKAVPLAGWYW